MRTPAFFATIFAVTLVACFSSPAVAQLDSMRVDEPITIGGMSVFFISPTKPPKTTPRYITLEESLRRKSAMLWNENSMTLPIQNFTDTAIFIQSGDLIKGGQQDRAMKYDQIVDPNGRDNKVEVVCIEHGRSTRRGLEPLETFSSSEHLAPMHHLRITPKSDLTQRLLTPSLSPKQSSEKTTYTQPDMDARALFDQLATVKPPYFGDDSWLERLTQESVWSDVESAQNKLGSAIRELELDPKLTAHQKDSVRLNRKDSVKSKLSPSSLELTLEEPRVQAALAKSVMALTAAMKKHPEATGFAFAIDGELQGIEIYRDHRLFESIAHKMFESAAAELLMTPPIASTPRSNGESDVEYWLSLGAQNRFTNHEVNARTRVGVMDFQEFYLFQTTDLAPGGGPMHWSFLRK